MAEIAIRWAVAHPAVTCALVGARNVKEFSQNVRAAESPLGGEVLARLNAATAPVLDKMGPGFDYYENSRMDRTR